MEVITIAGISIIPLVLALVEVLKRAVRIPKRYVPLLAIVIGVTFTIIASGLTLEAVVLGIVYALSAMGMWSGGKSVANSK